MKIVISLGGSVIVPDTVDYGYLKEFKKIISNFSKKNKVVIVTGGGSTCRKYLKPLEKSKLDEKVYSLIGIASTKLNARLVSSIFNMVSKIPESVKDVKNSLKNKNLVVCGALGFHHERTSDATAAEIAEKIKADYFINVTNVKGLFDKWPSKKAKLIKTISFEDFLKITNKLKFKAGQHFVLDQSAAKIIKNSKIPTYIINKNNLKKVLKGEKFIGTLIR